MSLISIHNSYQRNLVAINVVHVYPSNTFAEVPAIHVVIDTYSTRLAVLNPSNVYTNYIIIVYWLLLAVNQLSNETDSQI